MDPGRRKNERRDPDFVAVGEAVLIDSVLWTVQSFEAAAGSVTFHLARRQGERTFTRSATFGAADQVMVRNNLTPQS